jgi:hypothetical protein
MAVTEAPTTAERLTTNNILCKIIFYELDNLNYKKKLLLESGMVCYNGIFYMNNLFHHL